MVFRCAIVVFLCLCLSTKCNAYREFRRAAAHEEVFNPAATKRLMTAVGRSLSKIESRLQQQLFKNSQRSLHLGQSTFKNPLVRNLQRMQNAQNLGKYRFSSFPGAGKKTLMPQNLMPMISRRLMTTTQALRFGKVFTDQVAKQDMKSSRLLQGGSKEGECTNEQLKEFASRFGGSSAIDSASAAYKHPTSPFTALYLTTSPQGDHNGAFSALAGGPNDRGYRSMCARLMRMSAHYNVVFQQVRDVKEAIDFVQELKSDPDFKNAKKAIKHVTISGHGNPSTLVLGEGRLRSAELDRKSDTDTKKLLEELKPVLIHDGEARSSVFLDSCSTGKKVPGMGPPLAQLVANSLPGVEVHAFEDLMYPKFVKLQENFHKDAKFECSWELRGQCLKASVFMSKGAKNSGVSTLQVAQKTRPESDVKEVSVEDDDEFVFYDGVSFLGDPQMCAEWCSMIEECHGFQFVELLDTEESDASLEVDLGQCILSAAPLLEEEDESDDFEGFYSGEVDSGIDGLMLD